MIASRRVFVDTNILFYLFSTDDAKADQAEAILRAPDLERVISTQVVAELAANLRRKSRLGWPEIRLHLETIQQVCAVEPVLVADQHHALDVAARYGFFWWDAQIMAVALRCNAERLLTEDLQAGQRIGDILVNNPFA